MRKTVRCVEPLGGDLFLRKGPNLSHMDNRNKFMKSSYYLNNNVTYYVIIILRLR